MSSPLPTWGQMSSPPPTWGQMSSPRPTWGQMSSPRPTWGRPPSAVRPSAARLVSFVQDEKTSRLSVFVSQENHLYHCPRGGRCPHHGPRGDRCPHHGPRGDGRPRPSGRAQLGQSALSQTRNHLGVGLVARKPALPPPTWGQMSSPLPTWGRPPSAVRPSAARLVSFVQEEKSSRVSACVSQENQPYHCPRGGRCPHHRPRGDGRPRPSGRAQLG